MADLVPKAVVRGDLPSFQRAPQSPLPADVVVLPTYRLYTPGQISLATFLGSPIAGAWLLARNYKRLGRPGAGWLALVLGVVALGCLIWVAQVMPQHFRLAPSVLSIVLMSSLARALQGRDLADHQARGGRVGSWGIAVAAGVVSLVTVLAGAFGVGVGYAILSESPKIAFGESEVYYDDGATESEARAIGDHLADSGVMPTKRAATVKVTHPDHYEVMFVLNDEALHNDSHIRFFHEQAGVLSAEVLHDAPVDILLADTNGDVVQRLRWEDRPRRLAFGNDAVVYRDGVTEDEAREVGQVLAAQGVFTGEGVRAQLSRRGRLKLQFNYNRQPSDADQRFFHRLVTPISQALGGTAVDIVIVDDDGHERVRLAWETRPPADD